MTRAMTQFCPFFWAWIVVRFFWRWQCLQDLLSSPEGVNMYCPDLFV